MFCQSFLSILFYFFFLFYEILFFKTCYYFEALLKSQSKSCGNIVPARPKCGSSKTWTRQEYLSGLLTRKLGIFVFWPFITISFSGGEMISRDLYGGSGAKELTLLRWKINFFLNFRFSSKRKKSKLFLSNFDLKCTY